LAYYSEAILFDFENYYSIAKTNSYTSSNEFKLFCNSAGIGYKSKWPDDELLNSEMIEESFLVEEPVYDWNKLKSIVSNKLKNSNIQLKLNTPFSGHKEIFDFVINCTYSNMNQICELIGVEAMKFQMQDVIIPVFKSNIRRVGLTVMDGPFCSVMPKGFEKEKFLLYHARYSVVNSADNCLTQVKSNIKDDIRNIFADSANFFPFLKDAVQTDCLRTTRAIPINNNDERLSEIITYKSNPNFITVFSGKVSTAIKIAKQIRQGINSGIFNSNITI
jgi:hypothetical protein